MDHVEYTLIFKAREIKRRKQEEQINLLGGEIEMKKEIIKVVIETTKVERYELDIETEKDAEKLFDTYQNITIDGSLDDFKKYVTSNSDKVIIQKSVAGSKFEDVTVIDI